MGELQAFGISYPATSTGEVKVYDNWFNKSTLCSSGSIGRWSCPGSVARVSVSGNHVGGADRSLPEAHISVDTSEGTAPLSVHFNGSGSASTDGGNILSYQWRFGDGDWRGNEMRSSNPTYTFTTPGIYTVTLRVFNSYGVPSEYAYQKITVKPTDVTKHYLSAWVKDNYPGNISGKVQKQMLVNDQVVWTDDVAGNEGWTHVSADVTGLLHGGQNKVAYRISSISPSGASAMKEVWTFVDDISITGVNIQNTSMEDTPLKWNQKLQPGPGGDKSFVGSDITTVDARSGNHSLILRFGDAGLPVAGTYGEFSQTFSM
jgi:PKD repeat protein